MIAKTVVLFLVSAELIPADGQPAPLSTPVLKQRLAEAQARLWAWEIEYESAREDKSGVPAESYVHRLVAAKAPNRFFHWSTHGTPWLDWRDDPYQQRLIVTADRLFAEHPLDLFFNEQRWQPGAPLPGSAPLELLLTAPGWWPLAQRPSPILVDKLPAALSAVAKSAAYQARLRLEQVNGRWCHVLECPGRDQLWLDVERGCAIVVRQISYPEQARVHRVEFSNFREVLPGMWAPFALRNIHYERAPDGSLGKAVLDANLTVLRVRLNEQVDDARFQFKPLPGSIGKIGDQPLRQAVPGGEEYLDEVVEWIRRYSPQTDAPTSRAGWANWSDIALGALFGFAVVTALLWRPRWVSR
ncbi:MAG TPA: hypothetical protein VMF69_28945 [Gemmataceae bacterium]|nr:hypothetical protein [Gemmataceae bacterium]